MLDCAIIYVLLIIEHNGDVPPAKIQEIPSQIQVIFFYVATCFDLIQYIICHFQDTTARMILLDVKRTVFTSHLFVQLMHTNYYNIVN